MPLRRSSCTTRTALVAGMRQGVIEHGLFDLHRYPVGMRSLGASRRSDQSLGAVGLEVRRRTMSRRRSSNLTASITAACTLWLNRMPARYAAVGGPNQVSTSLRERIGWRRVRRERRRPLVP
jgi:hypothetical protein